MKNFKNAISPQTFSEYATKGQVQSNLDERDVEMYASNLLPNLPLLSGISNCKRKLLEFRLFLFKKPRQIDDLGSRIAYSWV
jgi:hypothetical protein